MAGGGNGASSSKSLEETPTWALATVCLVFISVSIFIEYLIHLLSHWLKKRRKIALFKSVEKLKSVLMVLGFMSLILTVTQKYIVKICIPNNVAYTMLPCRRSQGRTSKSFQERVLASTSSGSNDYCEAKGMSSLISQEGANQLSIFIFVLAVMQIVYSVLTMALGGAKMKRWKTWEAETQTVEYQAANDPERFRYTRETSFGRRHTSSCTRTSLQLWIKCFFRQFFHSVAKVDYLTLRHGFIAAHLSNNNSFNFQKYIQRSLEDDFKVIVGIRPFMWFLVVIFLLVDVHGWHMYLWVSFLPLVIVLVLGTKMEVIVAKMALQLQDQSIVIKGAPLVRPNDEFFWFSHPSFVLTLLHYTLFINAFELSFFIWVTLQFGIRSCYHEHKEITVVRVALAITVQVISSYITLPLYALVTQMGLQFKSAVLEEQTAKIIKQWHDGVKQKQKKRYDFADSDGSYHFSASPTPRSIASPDFHSRNHISSPEISPRNRMQIRIESDFSPRETEIVEENQIIDHIVTYNRGNVD